MNGYSPVSVKLWGDLACFTRPEFKVERVSYPVMTPSAARGALEAIFWKPQFRWRITEIRVLAPIRYQSILRNEIASVQGERTARGWQSAHGVGGFVASADRAAYGGQRHTLALRDVAYIVLAQAEVASGVAEDPAKFRDQLRRRAEAGRCFTRPYLGCREFAADFEEPSGAETPIDRTEDLGPMLLDLDYQADGSGRGTPRFFEAHLDRGVLRVPAFAEV